ncbi:hypothetical protein QO189_14070 [Psychrobacter sp. Arc29]|uniref:hypothetical protein n=1 Tax=Psychrobacter sp. Arc29 TaxID=3046690 RepID=UPI00352E31FF
MTALLSARMASLVVSQTVMADRILSVYNTYTPTKLVIRKVIGNTAFYVKNYPHIPQIKTKLQVCLYSVKPHPAKPLAIQQAIADKKLSSRYLTHYIVRPLCHMAIVLQKQTYRRTAKNHKLNFSPIS